MAFVVFGSVFTSAMTGNTALIGIAVGTGHAVTAILPLLALAGFVCGAALATTLCAPTNQRAGRKSDVGVLLVVEIGVLFAFALVWHVAGWPIERPTGYVLVLLSAAAMGIQGIAARNVAVPGINTIVVTSTMLGIVTTLTERLLRRPVSAEAMEAARTQAVIVIAYATGAALTAVLTWTVLDLVPWPPLAAALLSWICFERALRQDGSASGIR